MQVTGQLTAIHEIESIQDGKYQKQMFAITNQDGYEGREAVYAFELFGDKTSLLSKFSEGDTITVSANIECRYWKDNKYFTTLKAWKIEAAAVEQSEPAESGADPLPF